MPDITMCVNIDCKRREKCYRYMADPNPYRQAYADFGKEGECENFLTIRGIMVRKLRNVDADNAEVIGQFRGEEYE